MIKMEFSYIKLISTYLPVYFVWPYIPAPRESLLKLLRPLLPLIPKFKVPNNSKLHHRWLTTTYGHTPPLPHHTHTPHLSLTNIERGGGWAIQSIQVSMLKLILYMKIPFQHTLPVYFVWLDYQN